MTSKRATLALFDSIATLSAMHVPTSAQVCPELLGGWPYDGSYQIELANGYAYVGGEQMLFIVDVGIPESPRTVGSADLQSFVLGIAVSGGYAFIANGSRGLRVFDVSDPLSPREVGHLETGDWAIEVAVVGSHAFVAMSYAGMLVVDISDPTTPIPVGAFSANDLVYDVVVSGGLAYLAANDAGLRIVDVSDPTSPVELGFVDTPVAPSACLSPQGSLTLPTAAIASGSSMFRSRRIRPRSAPSIPRSAGRRRRNRDRLVPCNPRRRTSDHRCFEPTGTLRNRLRPLAGFHGKRGGRRRLRIHG